MTEHTDLIARMEAVLAGSRELDSAIAFATKWRPNKRDDPQSARSFAEHEVKHDYATAWAAPAF